MSRNVEYGMCDICGKSKPLNRKYYYYIINCDCCGGAANGKYHFEIVRHCNDCQPKEPHSITPLLYTKNLQKLL